MRLLWGVLLLSACAALPQIQDAGTGGGVSGNAGGSGGGSAGGSAGGVGGSGGGVSACPGCAGCCLAGVCKVGSAASACGAGGMTCDVCDNFETCAAGRCALTCDDTTCGSGCCQGGSCRDGGVDATCGTGGAACVTCGAAQHCGAGRTCVDFKRVTFVYYRNGTNCATNPDCAVTGDFDVARANRFANIYGTGTPSCTVIDQPSAQPPGLIINCIAYCNYNSIGGCCGTYPQGASQSSCSWTPPP